MKIIAVLSVLVAAIHFHLKPSQKEINFFPADFFPTPTTFVKIEKDSFIYYKVYNHQREFIGWVFPSEVEGYAGPIRFFMFTDTEARIQKIQVIEHQEDRAYVPPEKLEVFLSQFKERRISQEFQLDKDVDAISGATITCLAILKGINLSGLKAKHLGILEARKKEKKPGKISLGVFLLISLFCLGILAYLTKRRSLRWAVLLFTLIFLGFIQSYIFSLQIWVNILSGRFPSFPQGLFWFLIYGFAILMLPLAGRFYCGWLCPFGAAQDFFARINPFKNKVRNLKKWDKHLRHLKYILLWGFLIFALIHRDFVFVDYEPFATLFKLKGSIIQWGYLFVFLVAGILLSRFWCRYFCASGAGLGFFSFLCLRKLQIKDNCKGCYRCLDICPTGAISQGFSQPIEIDYAECIECNLCIKICPEKAIIRTLHRKNAV